MKNIFSKRNIVLASVLIFMAALVLVFTMAITIGPVTDMGNAYLIENYTYDDLYYGPDLIETEAENLRFELSRLSGGVRYGPEHIQMHIHQDMQKVFIDLKMFYGRTPGPTRVIRIECSAHPVESLNIVATPGSDYILAYTSPDYLRSLVVNLKAGSDIFDSRWSSTPCRITTDQADPNELDCIRTGSANDVVNLTTAVGTDARRGGVNTAFVDSGSGDDEVMARTGFEKAVVLGGDGRDYIRGSRSVGAVNVLVGPYSASTVEEEGDSIIGREWDIIVR